MDGMDVVIGWNIKPHEEEKVDMHSRRDERQRQRERDLINRNTGI
jgi:hypothetical protein